jgi:hypothetical protein
MVGAHAPVEASSGAASLEVEREIGGMHAAGGVFRFNVIFNLRRFEMGQTY